MKESHKKRKGFLLCRVAGAVFLAATMAPLVNADALDDYTTEDLNGFGKPQPQPLSAESEEQVRDTRQTSVDLVALREWIRSTGNSDIGSGDYNENLTGR